MKKILSLFGWIFLLLGVTLIGIGSLAYWRTSQLQAKGESATANEIVVVSPDLAESGTEKSNLNSVAKRPSILLVVNLELLIVISILEDGPLTPSLFPSSLDAFWLTLFSFFVTFCGISLVFAELANFDLELCA